MSEIIPAISRPVPMRPSEIAVVRIIATVMVRLRRSPVATSERTKLTRMDSLSGFVHGVSRPDRRQRHAARRLAPDPVHAARLVAGDDAPVELDDATAHGVDDV